ncbi:flavodoxin family protein [Nocardioides sp. SYSU DS0663]|uniref:flavodoxin family protein n=1 Tax=Nocardioides sp. SYSU DS0663 TaxID=3416445 RepID=UPI003F4B2ADD
MTDLRSLVLVCTLKPSSSGSSSSSDLIGRQVLDRLTAHGAPGEVVRVVDHQVRFGVTTDEGDGDEWPAIREKMLNADIFVIATPIWLGQPSSVTKMVLERLDAELGETDEEGRMLTFGKVAAVAVVGNEDGAHHTVAECLQALNDTGFSIAANGSTYWVGEAMHGTDYQDLDETPDVTAGTNDTAAKNSVHLARLLKAAPYPG